MSKRDRHVWVHWGGGDPLGQQISQWIVVGFIGFLGLLFLIKFVQVQFLDR
jgi:hypothetical protein